MGLVSAWPKEAELLKLLEVEYLAHEHDESAIYLYRCTIQAIKLSISFASRLALISANLEAELSIRWLPPSRSDLKSVFGWGWQINF